MAALKARWNEWASRFAALQQREKLMVAGAALVVILFGGYSFWIEPAQLQKARFEKTIAQQQSEQQQLQAQIAALAKGGDPDAPNRALLEQLRNELAAAEREIRGFDRVLVTPAQAPQLLQTLLARHRGLSLVSLTTLPPQPLVPPRPAKDDGKGAAKEAPAAAPGANIYKHGIEIRVAGGYHDLLAYVGELESGPQKLLWGGMRLAVQQHPLSELTLTIYTLSLEETWLAV
jgi:MSHA biogenesis protein MshJ